MKPNTFQRIPILVTNAAQYSTISQPMNITINLHIIGELNQFIRKKKIQYQLILISFLTAIFCFCFFFFFRVVSLYKQILTPPPSKKIRYNNAGEPQSAYYCHLCGIEYISKFNLEKHLERQHTEEERATTPV